MPEDKQMATVTIVNKQGRVPTLDELPKHYAIDLTNCKI